MRAWLKEIRIKLEMTHEQVAKTSNITRAYYTEIENGYKNPSVNVAKRIAETLEFEWTIFIAE